MPGRAHTPGDETQTPQLCPTKGSSRTKITLPFEEVLALHPGKTVMTLLPDLCPAVLGSAASADPRNERAGRRLTLVSAGPHLPIVPNPRVTCLKKSILLLSNIMIPRARL